MAASSAPSSDLDAAQGSWRGRTLVLLAVLIDALLAASSLGHLWRLPPVVRALEWPELAAEAVLFLAPALVATVAVIKRSKVVDAAIVINLAPILVFRFSLVVPPVVLVPVLLFIFGRASIVRDPRERGAGLRVGAAILGIAAALVFTLAPQHHVLWSTASSQGRVVEASAVLVPRCPNSLGQAFTGDEDSGANGCDPISDARASEVSLLLSGLAVAAAVGSSAIKGTAAARAH